MVRSYVHSLALVSCDGKKRRVGEVGPALAQPFDALHVPFHCLESFVHSSATL
jgi:hypothetical protein